MKHRAFNESVKTIRNYQAQFILGKTKSLRPEAVDRGCSVKNSLCQSFFFNEVAGPRPATLLKKRLRHRCFPVNFTKSLGTPFFKEHFRWLLQYGFSANSLKPWKYNTKRNNIRKCLVATQLAGGV